MGFDSWFTWFKSSTREIRESIYFPKLWSDLFLEQLPSAFLKLMGGCIDRPCSCWVKLWAGCHKRPPGSRGGGGGASEVGGAEVGRAEAGQAGKAGRASEANRGAGGSMDGKGKPRFCFVFVFSFLCCFFSSSFFPSYFCFFLFSLFFFLWQGASRSA